MRCASPEDVAQVIAFAHRHGIGTAPRSGGHDLAGRSSTPGVLIDERLAARPDAGQVTRRHAGYYRALAGQADRPLRGAGYGDWLERLQAEAGNLAAAVRWYLAHDRRPPPAKPGECLLGALGLAEAH